VVEHRQPQLDQPVNIVVVLADQLRRQALGTYGDPNVSTPHIDALAAEGDGLHRGVLDLSGV
jgi:arylsulfatase A-like enzyme